MGTTKPRKNYQTQWAGQFGAAHELVRRGYLVTFTMGNAPGSDLLCVSPEKRMFQIQVKSISSRTSFLFQRNLLQPNKKLYFILVLVPLDIRESPEYFIMKQEQLRKVIRKQDQVSKETGEKRGKPLKPFAKGVNYRVLADRFHFRNEWENLPQ